MRFAIELAIVKAKAVSGETDLRWIDARYQVADCLTKHASRKSEAVLQKILQEAHWRITAEEDMLDRRKRERVSLRGKRQLVKKVVGKKDFEECESGCAFNGVTDAVTNLLMKVQHVTVSENSDRNSCVSLTMVWTWNFLLSLQT